MRTSRGLARPRFGRRWLAAACLIVAASTLTAAPALAGTHSSLADHGAGHLVTPIVKTSVVTTQTGLAHGESIGDTGTANLGHSQAVPAVTVGACGAAQTIKFYPRKRGKGAHPPYLQGNAYITACTGEPPISCLPTAHIQLRSPTDPSVWTTEAEGGGDGCDPAGYASAIAFCKYSKTVYTYRTQAFFTIYWADGDITKAAGPYYSSSYTDNYICT